VKRTIVLSILTIFSLISVASAQVDAASSDPQRLFGTWKLVSYVGEEVPHGARSDVMGPRPSGYINYGPDGRMHVEISWDQSRTGTTQVRTYKLDGDRLTLITQPSNDSATGKKTVRTLVWEK
jgi:hypothetical protein